MNLPLANQSTGEGSQLSQDFRDLLLESANFHGGRRIEDTAVIFENEFGVAITEQGPIGSAVERMNFVFGSERQAAQFSLNAEILLSRSGDALSVQRFPGAENDLGAVVFKTPTEEILVDLDLKATVRMPNLGVSQGNGISSTRRLGLPNE